MPETARPLRQPYPTGISDAEWVFLKPLVPPTIAYRNFQEPKHSWADGVDNGQPIKELRENTGIDIEVVKWTDDVKGFVVVPRRWWSNAPSAGLSGFGCSTENTSERLHQARRMFTNHAMVTIMSRRLAGETTEIRGLHRRVNEHSAVCA